MVVNSQHLSWNSNHTMYRYALRDFAESVLEFTSIWRDMKMVLPGAMVSHISSFLKLSNIDQALIADDDEFIVGDEEETIDDIKEKIAKLNGTMTMKLMMIVNGIQIVYR